jgi:hypothetical protein
MTFFGSLLLLVKIVHIHLQQIDRVLNVKLLFLQGFQVVMPLPLSNTRTHRSKEALRVVLP